MLPEEKRSKLLIATGLVLAMSSCTRQADYSTYDDCVLDEVDSVQTPAAVRAVQDACRIKLPPTAAELAQRRHTSERRAIGAQSAEDAANRAAGAAAMHTDEGAAAATAAAEAAATRALED